MTERLAVVQGTYSDLRIIKTRSVVVISIEVPIERAKEITEAFGFPVPGESIHVAVARLNTDAMARIGAVGPEGESDEARGREFTLSQKAAMLCNDGEFQKFVVAKLGIALPADTKHHNSTIAHHLREHCNIESRRELDSDREAQGLFIDLIEEFEEWRKSRENARLLRFMTPSSGSRKSHP